jgi:glycosyltransferase involved in cell wall biosynthesis
MSTAVPLHYSNDPARTGTGSHHAASGASTHAAVTIVIPTLNESAQIGQAVADLSWADEVIVIDGGSTDDTVAIATAAGARVITVCGETIAAQRNAGIAAARNTWILALDADERVSPQLRAELRQVVAGRNPTHAAYRMKFRNHYLGRELRHGPWGRDWHVRLFTRERRYVTHRVHEHLESIDDVGALTGPIMHTPYRDISHHVAKIVKYARWGADDLHARGRRAGVWELTARPAWRFVRDYFVFAGWRDGMIGFVAAALSAFAAFLKYALLFARSQSADA